jgi:phosphoserine phosphatase
MSNIHETLAVVFDFDDTLLPDSTTQLLRKYGINPKKFWTKDVRALIRSGFDPSLAWLKLLVDNVGRGKPLGEITKESLREFGRTLDQDFYPGIPELFEDLRALVKKSKVGEIEFYIVSGGLQDIIEGSKVIRNSHFSGIYACDIAEDESTGLIRHVKRCVTFTEKTKYLFEINKGIDPKRGRINPYLVNKNVDISKRRIPFQNMIYVGDGLTDIPCFSLLKKLSGTAFGVFDPERSKSARRALVEFLKPDRVISVHAPRYRRNDELGSLLRAAVGARCAQLKIEAKQAERSV